MGDHCVGHAKHTWLECLVKVVAAGVIARLDAQRQHGTAVHAEIDHGVVFQHPRFDRRDKVGRQAFRLLPGDEVRTIDWNVTARTGQPYVKRYVEERELTVMLMVDASGSGDFGSEGQFKRELAAELASVLSFSATTNKDKVGLMIGRVEVVAQRQLQPVQAAPDHPRGEVGHDGARGHDSGHENRAG